MISTLDTQKSFTKHKQENIKHTNFHIPLYFPASITLLKIICLRTPISIFPSKYIKTLGSLSTAESLHFIFNVHTLHNYYFHGSLNASFHHPCFEQLPTILSSLIIISENFGLIGNSGYQHSSINSFKSGG